MNKEQSEFQKRIFSKMDEAMNEYISKKDVKGATAFAMKMKDKIEFILQAMQKENVANKSREERDRLLKGYQQQVEDNIMLIKQEVKEILARENQPPSYIGFIVYTDERRFE